MKMRVSKLKRFGMVALTLCLSLAMVESSFAAAFLKLGDIKGESTDNSHKEWIDVLSVGQTIKRITPEGATGSTRSRVVLGDIVVVKELDKATPKLAEAIVMGTNIGTVNIVLTYTGPDGSQIPYLSYELKNVLVTSYSVSGSTSGDSVPTEELSLNYEEIKWTYSFDEVDPTTGEPKKGNVEFEWKVEEGES